MSETSSLVLMVGAWSQTLLIHVHINCSQRALGGRIIRVGSSPRKGLGLGEASKLGEGSETKHFMKAFLWRVGDIMTERRTEARKNWKNFLCLPNKLAKPLGESF